MINAGLSFAGNDAINLDVAGGNGTHLSNSLKELSKLGVDTVTMSGGNVLSVDLGGFTNADAHDGVTLNQVGFAQGLDVTLDVANLSELNVATAMAGDLAGAGIDNVQINLHHGDGESYEHALDRLLVNHGATLKSDVERLEAADLNVDTLDVGGANVDAAVNINESQAGALINAGLSFASQDSVTLDLSGVMALDGLHVSGTVLNNSLHNIHKLGVDALGNDLTGFGLEGNNLGIDTAKITGIGGLADLSELSSALNQAGISQLEIQSSDFETTRFNFQTGKEEVIGSRLLKAFESSDLVTDGINLKLAINDSSASANQYLNDPKQSDNLALNKIVQHGVDLLPPHLSNDATWRDLIEVLKSSGLGEVEVESKANLHIGDELSAALYESGMLHALPDANIEIDVAANTKLLSTSLKAMADLGVDKVNSAEKVFVKLGVTENELSGIHDLFSAFGLDNADNTTQGQKIFANQAGLVLDQTSAEALGFKYSDAGPPDEARVTDLMQQLSKLGITEVDVVGTNSTEVHVYSMSDGAVAQTLGTPAIVELLGIDDKHQDIFDHEIKKP